MENNNTLKEIRDYVEKMDDYARQEVTRYVRGVYDGGQAIHKQYGLPPESVVADQVGKPPRDAA